MFDESVANLRNMYQTILMDADVHKHAEVNDIADSAFREYAGLKKDIVSIGVNNRIEIWNKENWKEYNEEENFISNDLAFEMENLGI